MADKQESAEAPADVVEDRRAPDQEGALEVAFVEGVLPEEDRRAPEPAAEPEAPDGPIEHPNDVLHVVRQRSDGVKVNAGGSIIDPG